MRFIFKIILIIIFYINLFFNLHAQVRTYYEQTYFSSPGFFTPAKIAPNKNYLYTIYDYDNISMEENNQMHKYSLHFFTYTPLKSNINGAPTNYILNANANISENSSIGILLDKYTFGIFNRASYALKYAYLLNLDNDFKISIGFSIGKVAFNLSNIDINNNLPELNILNDPTVITFNQFKDYLYTDIGFNIMYKYLNLQIVKYQLNKILFNNFVDENPELFVSTDYSFKSENVDYAIMLGIVTFNGKTHDNLFVGGKIGLKPISFSTNFSTLNKNSIGLYFDLSANIKFNIHYNFGSFYANPFYDNVGYLSAGLILNF